MLLSSIVQIYAEFNSIFKSKSQKDHYLESPNKRIALIIAGIADAIIGGTIVLIYFGVLPVNISGWGIPRWIIGLIGGVWFLGAVGFLAYQLTRTDSAE